MHEDGFAGRASVPVGFFKWISFLLIVSVASLDAGVRVFPTELFVIPPNRSAPINITNATDTEIEVWITFRYGYPVTYDSKNIEIRMFDTVTSEEQSAAAWLRAIPQRITLMPQENQTVRILGTPPAGMRDGEYWARVVIHAKESKRTAVAQGGGISIGMDVESETVVPYHYRYGTVTSGVDIREAKASVESRTISLLVDLERRGNAAFWGRLVCRLLNPQARPVLTQEFRMVVYKELTFREVLDVGNIPSGDYTMEITLDGQHPRLHPRYRINTEAVSRRLPVSIR